MSVKTTPVCRSIPFDNTLNGYISTNAQDAIEESKAIAVRTARYCVIGAYESTANTGRWLEFSRGNSSNTSPLIIVGIQRFEEITLVTADTASTASVTLYRNLTPLLVISLNAQKVAVVESDVILNDLDQLSLQVTAGTISKPQVQLFLRRD